MRSTLACCFVLGWVLVTAIFPFPVLAQATNHALIINQVRGGEDCCDPGSMVTLQEQIETLLELQLPGYFTLRFDALADQQFINSLQQARLDSNQQLQPGLFLEITPSLAAAARVNYSGNPASWYQAQYAYLIGYNPSDRRRLIDTAMAAYYQAFGSYPQVTTAWIIDTESLNYLHDQYGVQVHQITREQWGTDSYSLWGGPWHYPYPASRAWAFQPDFDQPESVLIVRQTVADPVANYADPTSSFTSQPNDFTQDGKTIEYSTHLLHQALSQPSGQSGFILLGLENTMPSNLQEIYHQQLIQLATWRQQGLVTFPNLSELGDFWRHQPLTAYVGRDYQISDKYYANITSDLYRIRIGTNGKNVFISDLRVYAATYSDPYATMPARFQGFWVVPAIIDSGRWHRWWQQKPFLAKLFGSPEVETDFFHAPHPDTLPNSSHLSLPDLAPGGLVTIDQSDNYRIILAYPSTTGPVTLEFDRTGITWRPGTINSQVVDVLSSKSPINWTGKLAAQWPAGEGSLMEMQTSCQPEFCRSTFFVNPAKIDLARQVHPEQLFPEPSSNPPSEISQRFIHNRFAIVGRNPIRVVVAPFDELGRPVSLDTPPTVTTTDPKIVVTETTNSLPTTLHFIDLTTTEPTGLSTSITINVDPLVPVTNHIFFAPDCLRLPLVCTRVPIKWWWYLQAVTTAKIGQLIGG